MAHFAKLGKGNKVEQVVVVNNDVITDANGQEQEQLGVDFLNKTFGTNDVWKQTSYNGSFRKNFAGLSFKYDQYRDAFIEEKPFASWTLDEDTCQWNPPVEMPNDGRLYKWNEENQSWDLRE